MDKISDIPVQQQVVIILVFMLLLAGGFYFVSIAPTEESINSATGKYNTLAQEYNKLAEFKQEGMLEKLEAEEETEEQKIEQNRRMLPSDAELPSFIESIKADADASDLVIQRFEIGETEHADFYKKIPIEVRALGTFPRLIDFFRILAAPSKRTVNIHNITVVRLSPGSAEYDNLAGIKKGRYGKDERTTTATTPEQKRYMKVLEIEEKNARAFVDASFTVYAFSYTGKMAPLNTKQRH
jgi:Tfp pilus assembly protein PilO